MIFLKIYSTLTSVFFDLLRRKSSLILASLILLALNFDIWKRNFVGRKPPTKTFAATGIISSSDDVEIKSSVVNDRSYDNVFDKDFPQPKIPRHRYSSYPVPGIQPKRFGDEISCQKILDSDASEIDKGVTLERLSPKVPISEEEYLRWTSNCEAFKEQRGYIQAPTSIEEAEYALAYSISSYRDIEQTERLLRSIYQPQNLYCIHMDIKSPLLFHQALASIARCFKNVWIATSLNKIKWGDVSVLMSEMNCLKDIVRYFRGRYKYFINLTGQEFPLRTNAELVRVASIFNGSNDVAGSVSNMDMDRVKYVWKHRWSKTYQQTIFYKSDQPIEPCPLNVTFFKGEVHALMSRKFTEYIIEDPRSKIFFEWSKNTGHPSEHFWNTLNYNQNLDAPGSYIGDIQLAEKYSPQPIVRAKNWVGLWGDDWPCHGHVTRGICVYGIRDVARLFRRPHLFANKFNLTFESVGYDCLEEAHRNRTRARKVDIDSKFYRNLPTVLYSLKNGL